MEPTRSIDERTSRRAVLGAAAAGAAAMAAGRLLGPGAADAGTGTFTYGTLNDAGASKTSLSASAADVTLAVTNDNAGDVAGGALAGFDLASNTTKRAAVSGYSYYGVGVRGHGEYGGTGVIAEVGTQQYLAYGLKVKGRVGFSSAGTASVKKRTASVKVDNISVTKASKVIATIQGNRSGTWVRGVVCYDFKFRIYLNKKVTAATKIAYFVID